MKSTQISIKNPQANAILDHVHQVLETCYAPRIYKNTILIYLACGVDEILTRQAVSF